MARNNDLIGYEFTRENDGQVVNITKDAFEQHGGEYVDLTIVHGDPVRLPIHEFKELMSEHRNSNITLDVQSILNGRYNIRKIYRGDAAVFRLNEPGAPHLDGGRRKARRMTKRNRKSRRRSSRRN